MISRRAFLGLIVAVIPGAAAAQWDYGIRTPRPNPNTRPKPRPVPPPPDKPPPPPPGRPPYGRY
jgi:hypothetical protein